MITIAHRGDAPPPIWVPVKPGATVYTGGIVAFDSSALTDQGVINMGVAAGASNTTNKDRPFGVVLGNNLKIETWNSTYKADYITAAAAGSSHGDTTEYTGVEGPWGKGDIRAMVKVELISPESILKADIKGSATVITTALTLLTVTTGSSDGLGVTTNATQVTPVADLCTAYCRSGANAGSYRILDTTSTTVHTWTQALNHDVAVGDTFVIAPVTPVGIGYLQTAATAVSWIDGTASPATDYFVVHVIRLDLREAGKEYVEFQFDGDNFNTART